MYSVENSLDESESQAKHFDPISVKIPSLLETVRIGIEMKKDFVSSFLRMHQRHGDIVRMRIPFKGYLLSSPKHVEYVLKENAKNYEKPKFYQHFDVIIGQGLAIAEGEDWKLRRKMVAPEFHSNATKTIMNMMYKNCQEMCSEWEQRIEKEDSKLDIMHEMEHLALGIISEYLFGLTEKESGVKVGEAMARIWVYMTNRMMNGVNIPRSIPTFSNVKAKLDLLYLRKEISSVIDRKAKLLQDGNEAKDVISKFIQKYDLALPQERARSILLDDIIVFLVGGHDTTSTVLSWVFYLLWTHPETEKRVYSECVEFTKHIEEKGVDSCDFGILKYTLCVIKEVIRLYPAAPLIGRKPLSPDNIYGLEVDPTDTLAIPICAIHRHPDYWDSPNEFRPERFEKDEENPAFLPFGEGPRSCPGKTLAMVEIPLLLATILSKFRLTREESTPIKWQNTLSLKPHNLYMKAELRK